MEPITVVITGRDRFSTAETCIHNVLRNTYVPFKLLVVLGGTPSHIEKKLKERFNQKVEFIFKPHFLNTAQARNVAIKQIKTKLTVCIDTDIFVRPHWLKPLIDCQSDTGAALVTPIVLERGSVIHTAGNDLYVTKQGKKNYGFMELRFSKHKYLKSSNMKRSEIGFAEVHCHLLLTDIARDLPIYDENLREHHEMDAGLTLKEAGHKMMFEPNSVVFLYYTPKLKHLDDVAFYKWKWDLKTIQEGFKYFEKKWGIDLNIKNGFVKHLKNVIHRRVGTFTRHWPSNMSLKIDWHLYRWLKKMSDLSPFW